MLRLVPIALRLARFEILALVLIVTGLAVANLVVAYQLNAIGVSATCLADARADDDACRSVTAFLGLSLGTGGVLVAVATALPVVIGVLLGVPLIASEVEDRSATLAWSLDASRLHWSGGRAITIGLVAVGLLVVLAVTGDILEGARHRDLDPAASFSAYGARSIPLIARGLVFFSLALLAGALMGRLLPGLVVAAVLVSTLFAGVTVLRPMLGSPIVVEGGQLTEDHLLAGMPYRRDGVLYSDGSVETLSPEALGSRAYYRWRDENFEQVIVALPPEQYPRVVAVESAVLLAIAALAVAATGAVISRRRPYP